MVKTYSQLIYRQVEPSAETQDPRTVIALHGNRGGHDDLLPLVNAIDPGLGVVAPEAARSVYRAMTVISHTWFGGTRVTPEPASFGDSLSQLERFVHDVIARQEPAAKEPPILLGYHQGATLALSLAEVIPDLLGGVIAIAGCLPYIRGWRPEWRDADQLPVLIIAGEDDQELPSSGLQKSIERLSAIGAQTQLASVSGEKGGCQDLVSIVQKWFETIDTAQTE